MKNNCKSKYTSVTPLLLSEVNHSRSAGACQNHENNLVDPREPLSNDQRQKLAITVGYCT